MDEERISRYRDKISVITKRRDNISSWIQDRDEKSTLAVYKAYQEMILELWTLKGDYILYMNVRFKAVFKC